MKTHSLCKASVLAAVIGTALSFGAFANDQGHGAKKMEMMDTDNDGKISAEEHAAGARKMFEKMDTNRDGRVTAAEMQAGSKAMGMQDGEKSGKPMTSAVDKIKTIDTDGDGVITAQEHEAGSRAMFEKMDTDHDGYLSTDELMAGHRQMMGDKTQTR